MIDTILISQQNYEKQQHPGIFPRTKSGEKQTIYFYHESGYMYKLDSIIDDCMRYKRIK